MTLALVKTKYDQLEERDELKPNEQAQRLWARFNNNVSYRVRWEGMWQGIARYMGNPVFFSGASQTPDSTVAVDFSTFYFDSETPLARDRYVAMLIALGTNPMAQWMSYSAWGVEQPNDATMRFCDDVSRGMLKMFGRDGLYRTLRPFNANGADYGNAVMRITERGPVTKSRFQGFNFEHVPFQQVFFEENGFGEVDCLFRCIWMTPYQAMTYFNQELDRVPPYVEEAAEKGLRCFFRFVLATEPEEPTPGMPWFPKRWRETWLCDATLNGEVRAGFSHIVRQSKIDYFPYIIFRDETYSGEIYARGRAALAIASIRSANVLKQRVLQASAQATNPTILKKQGVRLQEQNFLPSKIATISDLEGIKAWEFKGNLDFYKLQYESEAQAIKRAFFTDQIEIAPDRPQDMKATVAIEIANRNRAALAPTFISMNDGLYTPLADKALYLYLSKAFSKEELAQLVPEQIKRAGGHFDVTINSPMAMAQKRQALESTITGFQLITNVAAAFPSAADKVDADVLVDEIAEGTNMDLRVIRKPSDVTKIRQAKQAAEQAQQQAELLAKSGPGVKALADAQATAQGQA